MENFHAPELFIDKEGKWYSDNVLMTRPEIILLFSSHLAQAGPDTYHIDWQNKIYPVNVEDVPFFAQSVFEQENRLFLRLYDGREFMLPSGNLVIKNRIPYISLFWTCDTKLSRPAYNELCRHLVERDCCYFIQYGDNEWPVVEAR